MASIVEIEHSPTIATSQLQVSTEIQRADDFYSLRNEAAPGQPNPDESAYEGIKWNLLRGFIIPTDDVVIDSGVWKQGYRLCKQGSDRIYWLCKQCHTTGRTKRNSLEQVLYVTDKATSSAIAHLKSVHNIDQNSEPVQKRNKRLLDEYYNPGGYSKESTVDNTVAASFDIYDFKAALYAWIINNNVPFEQIESESLRQMFCTLQPRCQKHIPSADTVNRTITALYDKAIGTVTESLQSAITKINFSFDLWTSKNQLALLGLCAHFINNDGKPITTLLALPKQAGKHSGFNMAETVNAIIASYSLQDKVGYFTTDNASANKTCLELIAKEHGFDYDKRWVRCCGHVFNLVGQAALFGSDSEAFSSDIAAATVEELELQRWRKKGPIGKLHNIVHWINRSPQRVDRFKALQRKHIAPVDNNGNKMVYSLIKDVETRWNSFYYSAERACKLRTAIDELLLDERSEYDRNCARSQQSNTTEQQKPPILDDMLTTNDWDVITRYVHILKPLKDATKDLEGHIGGQMGAIWRVLPQYEEVLYHFEDLVNQYPIDETAEPDDATTAERHFNLNIKLAWKKMDEYYAKLDNSPLYVAAVVLHPHFKWKWIEKQWRERSNWIKAAKDAFNDYLFEYEHAPMDPPESSKPTPTITTPESKRRRIDDPDSDSESEDSERIKASIFEQLTAYSSDKSHKELVKDRQASPLPYWLSKRHQWPHLTALALNVYAVPPMSDEPERVFSITGAAITPRRRNLTSDKINDSMCLKAWLRAKVLIINR